MIPDCMLETVLRPITVQVLQDLFWKFCCFLKQCLRRNFYAGQITPPKYSPFEETAQKVVAVPNQQ